MSLKDMLGEGLRYRELDCGPQAAMAAQFPAAAACVVVQMELDGERGATGYPYQDWTFHRMPDGRWVARLTLHKASESVYIVWLEASFGGSGRDCWERDRDGIVVTYGSSTLLAEMPTTPIRMGRVVPLVPRGIPPDLPVNEYDTWLNGWHKA